MTARARPRRRTRRRSRCEPYHALRGRGRSAANKTRNHRTPFRYGRVPRIEAKKSLFFSVVSSDGTQVPTEPARECHSVKFSMALPSVEELIATDPGE